MASNTIPFIGEHKGAQGSMARPHTGAWGAGPLVERTTVRLDNARTATWDTNRTQARLKHGQDQKRSKQGQEGSQAETQTKGLDWRLDWRGREDREDMKGTNRWQAYSCGQAERHQNTMQRTIGHRIRQRNHRLLPASISPK